ncbi:hypothetical protein [Zoogloea sp. 1C4]|uniref:hypothetical protein n=1 Tax=Zoogloea sp. 1C4 TaxID=2570190 RepID=UPI0012915B73|nr:hypothetical protein [Zoogloea sp. 1C4]
MIENKVNFLVFVVLVSFLWGCATRPVSSFEAKIVPVDRLLNSDYAKPGSLTTKVTVKRDVGVLGSACSSRFFLNAAPIADIDSGEKVELHLLEGEYIVSVWPNGMCGGGMSESRLTLVKGREQSFRIGYGSNGDFYINPTAF